MPQVAGALVGPRRPKKDPLGTTWLTLGRTEGGETADLVR